MSRNTIRISSMFFGMLASAAVAGIPQPDAVLHGRVFIDGLQVTATDDVAIIARVAGVQKPVGYYHMGQSFTAGDNYVLRIRVESLSDESDQSDNAAIVGQTAQIFIRQGNGPELEKEQFTISAIGMIQQLTLGADCETIRPSIVHSTIGQDATSPCTGYIDPRIESDDGVNVNRGISEFIIVFNEEIRDRGGASLTEQSFSVRQTGGETPPSVQSINATVVDDKHVVTIALSRVISVREWTTIEADVEDLCGNPITSSGPGSAGDLGPSVDEPDRVDVAFLPGDIDQSGVVHPFDLLAFRVGVTNEVLPDGACSTDVNVYLDINRGGSIDPFDLLDFRRIANGVPPATRPWNGLAMNNSRP